MDTFRTNKSIPKQDHNKVISMLRLASIIFTILVCSSSLDMAYAQSPKAKHPTSNSKTTNMSGIDTLTPKEADDKNTPKESRWNGSYVGVNAGTSFGATAGTNVVLPLRSASDK